MTLTYCNRLFLVTIAAPKWLWWRDFHLCHFRSLFIVIQMDKECVIRKGLRLPAHTVWRRFGCLMLTTRNTSVG